MAKTETKPKRVITSTQIWQDNLKSMNQLKIDLDFNNTREIIEDGLKWIKRNGRFPTK